MSKTAIITGASSGIGKSIALKLAAEGINVALVARSEDKLSLLAEQINNQGNGKAISIPTDVSIREEVETMVEKVTSEFGGIEYFVNRSEERRVGKECRYR